MAELTGWERENRVHFDDIVAEYEKIRPEWPDAIFDDIARLGFDGNKAVEIGAGTGKATRRMLDMGWDVTAVEISANMTEFLRNRFGGGENFRVVTAPFEDAPFAEAEYDLIYAAAAFHWVNAEIGAPKALKMLKKGGKIALFRYCALDGAGDEVSDAVNAVFAKYFDKFYGYSDFAPYRPSHADLQSRREVYKGFRLYDLRDYGFTDTRMSFYDASFDYTADEYVAFLNTLSSHRKMPDELRREFHSEVIRAINARGGSIRRDYTFWLYTGAKER